MRVHRQADPRWSADKLGFGSLTLGSSGCLLTCITMAAEQILKIQLTPPEANEKAKAVKAFANSLIVVPNACAALGLRMVERVRDVLPYDPNLARTADAALANQGVCIIHVDHDEHAGGDHFIVVFDKDADGNYLAADPAPGAVIQLDKDLCGESQWGKQTKKYLPVGAIHVARA